MSLCSLSLILETLEIFMRAFVRDLEWTHTKRISECRYSFSDDYQHMHLFIFIHSYSSLVRQNYYVLFSKLACIISLEQHGRSTKAVHTPALVDDNGTLDLGLIFQHFNLFRQLRGRL